MTTPLHDDSRQPLVLASASRIRADLLRAAGLEIEVLPAEIDEAAVKAVLTRENPDFSGADMAEILARTKASTMSETRPDAMVIGADQVLDCEGRVFDKPEDMDEARRHLVSLRGRAHRLLSSVACARGGEVVWHHQSTVTMHMRDFSNAFLGTYLGTVGEDALTSVGAYKLEGLGSHLFERIEGDYFAVLGLPLLELLAFLRTENVVAA